MTADWIAVDWGTSHLRAWVMQGDQPVQALQSDQGMGRLNPAEFEPALLALIDPYLDPEQRTMILCCGMVGAAQGWQDAGYRAVPCPPVVAGQAISVAAGDPRLDVRILPGLKQAEPADVMRGEETQIAGFLADQPGFSGVFCLPGTHSKWVQVANGQVARFTSFMTGEVFALLAGHSVLRHSVGTAEDWDKAQFLAAVGESLTRPETLLGDLFGVRAGMLLHEAGAGQGRAQLSGRLLGQELAGAVAYWREQEVVLIGAAVLCQHYQLALAEAGAKVRRVDGDALVLAGLTRARHDLTTFIKEG